MQLPSLALHHHFFVLFFGGGMKTWLLPPLATALHAALARLLRMRYMPFHSSISRFGVGSPVLEHQVSCCLSLLLSVDTAVCCCCSCCCCCFCPLLLFLAEQEQSSGLFTLGVVSYCLGVALVCERLNLSHEVGAPPHRGASRIACSFCPRCGLSTKRRTKRIYLFYPIQFLLVVVL